MRSLEVKQNCCTCKQVISTLSECRFSRSLTSDRGEVDADEQREEGGDIVDYVGHVLVLGRVTFPNRWQIALLYQHAQIAILRPHVLYNRQKQCFHKVWSSCTTLNDVTGAK